MSAGEPARSALEDVLGHRFRDAELLEMALTHPSFAHETNNSPGNERLEFLGDAVVDLVVAQLLYEGHPSWAEGDLTRARAALVNTQRLAEHSRALGLPRYLRLGRTERRSGGADKDSILGNLFEAVVGALFLDGGLAPVTELLGRTFAAELGDGAVPERDPKTRFQEWAHARFKQTPAYQTLADSGAHDDERRFTVEVSIDDEVWGRGAARTKRQAERMAAQQALLRAERQRQAT